MKTFGHLSRALDAICRRRHDEPVGTTIARAHPQVQRKRVPARPDRRRRARRSSVFKARSGRYLVGRYYDPAG